LWSFADQLLGRVRLPASSALSVDDLPSFSDVSVVDVVSAIVRLPNNSSAADLLTIPLMKAVAVELAPCLTTLFNPSMASSYTFS